MRVTSGKFRGRTLVSPRSEITHPMGDRERLALFNTLMAHGARPRSAHARVLDAYAGTGSLGIEALSRGYRHADFIENDRRALIALRQNIDTMGASSQAKVYPRNVAKLTALKTGPAHQPIMRTSDMTSQSGHRIGSNMHRLSVKQASYDLIFIDPPYDSFRPDVITRLVRFLKPNGFLVLSHPATFTPDSFIQMTLTDTSISLNLLSTRHYARANISIFTLNRS